MTPEEEKRTIADHLRHMTNEDQLSDDEAIRDLGGDTHNRIIVDFGDGQYLYKSVDSNITLYTLIDTNDLSRSRSGEPIDYALEKELAASETLMMRRQAR